MDLQQKLGLVILQSVNEGEKIEMASLAMNLNYGVIPYVPSIKVLFCCDCDVSRQRAVSSLNMTVTKPSRN